MAITTIAEVVLTQTYAANCGDSCAAPPEAVFGGAAVASPGAASETAFAPDVASARCVALTTAASAPGKRKAHFWSRG
eukprot:6172889-Pleurochrysis_carterae.AAC.1